MSKRSPRRKKDGSYELLFLCPTCGGSKLEVNSVSLLFHCWNCGSSGRKMGIEDPSGIQSSLLSSKDGTPHHDSKVTSPLPISLSSELPLFALQECRRRRQEPQWLLRRYGVGWSWDEGRLYWPTSPEGGVLRSVLSWETPKTKNVGPKGLIGYQQLGKRQRLVLCEGDWKAASIPVPWVGLGLCGVHLSEAQRASVLLSEPEEVLVCLDGGWEREAQKIVEQLLPLRAKRIDLPWKGGPDDGPRNHLVRILLDVK